ncbi:MAG: hypothetical protein SOX04_06805 [Eubacteriales bacterium]|nr:hypothetical protein [Eubacteriales bacterium]MDY6078418.1 hypothetical protein [Eubacteriales bacterium]
MDAKKVSWELFKKTGSPATYLLYSALGKDDAERPKNGRET